MPTDNRQTVTLYQDKHSRWRIFDGRRLLDDAFDYSDAAHDHARALFPDAVITVI